MKYCFSFPWKYDERTPGGVLCETYRKRLSSFVDVEFSFTKGATSPEGETRFFERELERVRQGNLRLIALDERGVCVSSLEFSNLLEQTIVTFPKGILFLIGGSWGLPGLTLPDASVVLSLSKMTFPHELALLFLLEQTYRSRLIMNGHPYHHQERSSLAKKKGLT